MDLAANRNVLIVDDSKLMRMMLKKIVEELNMFDLIEEAENGKIALEKLDNSEFEIILLDIEMPIMNGVEALREIRLHHKAKVIIGPHGAGFVNLVFCKKKTKIIEIKPVNHTNELYKKISKINDLKYKSIKLKKIKNNEKGDMFLRKEILDKHI